MTMRTLRRKITTTMILLTTLYTIQLTVHGQIEIENLRARANKYEPMMIAAASKHHIDPRLLWTVAYLESRFRPELISPVGARGMMQFMPATALKYHLENPHDAPQSIEAAARYLKDLSLRFNNRLDLVLAAYNAGEGAVESYRSGVKLVLATGKIINPERMITGGVPPYKETRNYVTQGISVFASLKGTRPNQPDLETISSMQVGSAGGAGEEDLQALRRWDSFYVDEINNSLLKRRESPPSTPKETPPDKNSSLNMNARNSIYFD